jgi:hypothetical protein
LHKIATISSLVHDSCQENVTTLGFSQDDLQEMTTSSFHAHILKEKQPLLVMSDYHLIFDLNGVLIVTGEGQTKSCPMVLRLGLK